MNVFNLLTGKKPAKDYQFKVEISESVVSRITDSIKSSDVEEGGKFLGRIAQKGNQVIMLIQTYIDSGPRVSNSETHIMPDGEYQESLFRIVEGHDPEIEHIGSWHSHHCNGYPELSNGDIRGYASSVNDQNYNLDWFFVLLVTQVKKPYFEAKYYAFHRGDKRHYTISQECVQTVNSAYRYDSILREAEMATLSHRKHGPGAGNISAEKRAVEEIFSNLRAEDKVWFARKYPKAQVVKSKRDGSLSWKWSVLVNKESIQVIYTYPINFDEHAGKATLKFRYRQEQILGCNIDLNSHRFRQIEENVDNAKKHIINLNPVGTNAS